MQQHLVFETEAPIDWRLDERTKLTGLKGVASARATLAACRPVAEEFLLRTAA